MNANDFQRLSARTECDLHRALTRINRVGLEFATPDATAPMRLLLGAGGAVKEASELLDVVEKWIFFSRPLDVAKIIDEGGDALHYLAMVFRAAGVSMEEVMERNYRKLQVRYPEGYCDEKERNRDRGREGEAVRKECRQRDLDEEKRLYQDGHGFGHADPMETEYHKPPECEHKWEAVATDRGPVKVCTRCWIAVNVDNVNTSEKGG